MNSIQGLLHAKSVASLHRAAREDSKGQTPLFYACSEGNLEMVKLLVEYKADTTICDCEGRMPIMIAAQIGHKGIVETLGHVSLHPDKFGRTIVHYACAGGNVELLKYIIARVKLDACDAVSLKDSRGWTPLFHACHAGQVEMVVALVSEFEADPTVQDNDSYTALQVAVLNGKVAVAETMIREHVKGTTLLHTACSVGNIEIVRDCLEKESKAISSYDCNKNTPLHVAALWGQEKVVAPMIRGDVNVKGHLGRTPLHAACCRGHASLAKNLILKFNADINARDDWGHTPLQVAVLYSKVAVAETIREYVKGTTLLHTACSVGNIEIVRDCLEKESKAISSYDCDKNMPLHVAALWGQEKVVATIIKEFRGDVNVRGHLGRTPLHAACCGGHASLAKNFISKYKADINAQDNKDHTPLQVAVLYDQVAIAETIIREHVKGTTLLHTACSVGNIGIVRDCLEKESKAISSYDCDKNTPLHVAALWGQEKVVAPMISEIKGDVNVKGHLGRTPLHAACCRGHVSIARTLISKYKADITARDEQNDTPLHVAATGGKYAIMQMLISEFECDSNIKGHLGRTPLHAACYEGHVSLARNLIVKCKADINARDDQDHTPLQVAVLNDKVAMAATIIREHVKGTTLLHTACSVGNVRIVRASCLVKESKYDCDKNTPLHVAALWGQERVVATIIKDYRGDVNVKGHFGRTPLHAACCGGHASLAKNFISKYKADINARDDQDHTPLQVAVLYDKVAVAETMIREHVKGTTLLHTACRVGNIGIVRDCLEKESKAISSYDWGKNTPLHVAALWGQEEVVTTIIKNFKGDVNVKGHLGRTPLHAACCGGHVSLAKSLISKYKADINARDDQDHTPLQVAVLYDNVAVAETMIRGHVRGTTLLHTACSVGNIGIVRDCLEKESKAISSYDCDKNTPLHVAALWGQEKVVATIAKDFKGGVNLKGHLGRTPLHAACCGGHVDLARNLISKYKADINARDDQNNTPLHLAMTYCKYVPECECIKGHLGRESLHACCEGHVSLARNLIFKYKADINAQDDRDRTPLQVAVLYDKVAIAQTLIRDFVTGTTLLHTACSVGNTKIVRDCLKRESKAISSYDSYKNTPLHVAALWGQEEVVATIINDFMGVVNARGYLGRTPLHAACCRGHVGLAKNLISKFKADINARDDQDHTPLQVAVLNDRVAVAETMIRDFVKGTTLLHTACSVGNIGIVRNCLERESKGISSYDCDKNTPLHVAALWGQEKVVPFFKGDVNIKGYRGRTPLHAACCGGHVSLARNLISEHQADINARDDQKSTPLHVAASGDKEDVVLMLINEFGCDSNIKGHLNRTPLHAACCEGHVSLAKILISNCNADISAQDDQDHTPLQVAVLNDQVTVAETIIREHDKGTTLLHTACSVGNINLIFRYLESRAINTYDCDKNTPLHVAALWGQELAVTIISFFKGDVNIKGYLGRTPLHAACCGGHVNLARHLISIYKANINARDDQNSTPLYVAATGGKEDVVLMLINEFGCDSNVKGHLGRTPLHAACCEGHISLAKNLISNYKADIDAQDDQNNTALYVAAAGGKEDVVLMLINEFGCDSNIKGHLDRSLLHAACCGGHVSLAKNLISDCNADISARDDQDHTPLQVAVLYDKVAVAETIIREHVKGTTLLHTACSVGNIGIVRACLVKESKAISSYDCDKNTPLHVAALWGQEKVVAITINEFAGDVNIIGHLGRTPLHAACREGHVSLAWNLISKYKADINARDDQNNTPLHLAMTFCKDMPECECNVIIKGHLGRASLHACCEGHVSLARNLISKYKANINAKDIRNYTPLQVAVLNDKVAIAQALIREQVEGTTLLHTACSVGNIGIVRDCLEKESEAISSYDCDKNTPLHVAALWGQEKVVAITINEFAGDVNIIGHLGRSPLHAACREGHVSLAWNLISKYKADINAQDDQDHTPLQVAVLYDNVAVAETMIRGHVRGTTLLHTACSVGNIGIVRDCLEKESKAISSYDSDKNTPLHVAALWGQEKVVATIAKDFNGGVNVKGHLGRSPLHAACCGGHVNLARNLISKYKADINARDDQNYTPLQVSVLCGQIEVAKVLIAEFQYNESLLHVACRVGNVDIVKAHDPAAIKCTDFEGNSPLHVAAFWGKCEVVDAIVEEFKCSVNVKGRLGRTPLHAACKGGHLSLARNLISKYNADKNAQDYQNNTPLHVAALSKYGKKVALALIREFQCDPAVRGSKGRSLLHSACAGGNLDLVVKLCEYKLPLEVDSNGDTPLHTAAALGHSECVKALLSHGAPILVRNNCGKTALDVATGKSKAVLDTFMHEKRNEIYEEYDAVQKLAKKKYSGAEYITRIFVIGNPGAGKSSLIETMKRENWYDYLFRVSESSVPPRTAGIIPSIHMSKYCGRVLFYDFAGDPEYYSSHAAILESLTAFKKGFNIFVIVADLREDILSITRNINYWATFIHNQAFQKKDMSFIVVGSHIDQLSWTQKEEKCQQFRCVCDKIKLNKSCFVLNCCRPQSYKIIDFKKKIGYLTKNTPCYDLSFQASILLGLLEKDFSRVISCPIETLLSHIEDTSIDLPKHRELLFSVLNELQGIGLLLLISTEDRNIVRIVLQISQLTNKVHELLFSKEALKRLGSGRDSPFNIGIIPEELLFPNDTTTLSNRVISLPKFITKECLIQLQYCQEIHHEDIHAFLPPSNDFSSQSYLFFPALCLAQKHEVDQWNNPIEVRFSQGWLALCTDQNDYFPPRFLHVLLLRLVFKFTLSANASATLPDHSVFQRRCCRMWSNGVFWSMHEGVKCIVELVKDSKAVVILVKSNNQSPENFIKIFSDVIACVKKTQLDFCRHIKPKYFLLDSTDESDYLDDNHLYEMTDVERVLKNPQNKEVIYNVAENGGEMAVSRLQMLFPVPDDINKTEEANQDQASNLVPSTSHQHQEFGAESSAQIYPESEVFSQDTPGSSFASYVSSLPPAARPHLEYQLDWDNDVDRDLRQLAHHMRGWDVELSTHLCLTEVDISDIKQIHIRQPELQRREALIRWKKKTELRERATYGNLLQVFVDAGHAKCAKKLCQLLKDKYKAV